MSEFNIKVRIVKKIAEVSEEINLLEPRARASRKAYEAALASIQRIFPDVLPKEVDFNFDLGRYVQLIPLFHYEQMGLENLLKVAVDTEEKSDALCSELDKLCDVLSALKIYKEKQIDTLENREKDLPKLTRGYLKQHSILTCLTTKAKNSRYKGLQSFVMEDAALDAVLHHKPIFRA